MATLYSEEFLESFKTDPIAATRQACKIVFAVVAPGATWTLAEMEALEEADVLMSELSTASMLPVAYQPLPLAEGTSRSEHVFSIWNALKEVNEACELLEIQARKEELAKKFRIGLGSQFSYEFAPADLERVQSLLNELRDLVASTTGFKSDHQRRILARLESLQRELHKRVSDLDRFWGLVGDAGVMMAKLGNDAKPIVDRIREIADIVWNTQGRAEQLPSSAKPPQIGYDPTQREDAEA
ncbi:MAG: hypothetical protein IV094_21880 [Vitreoscilla sp.]|nr:hypothetical protein [Vitreoscilla sp.]